VTNRRFRQRVIDLCQSHLVELEKHKLSDDEKINPSLPGPIITTLTPDDTGLFPSTYVSAVVAYASPWTDLCSENPLVANLSRQILNLEVAYANFCGCRSIIVPGPRDDSSARGIAQYARAIQEVLLVASRVSIIIHLPMYREPGLEETEEPIGGQNGHVNGKDAEIDIFSAWDSWHTIRSVCSYNARLFVGRMPKLPSLCHGIFFDLPY
jgi:type II protein arginine methyltransferase